MERALRSTERPLIVDVGSGNGRFASWLREASAIAFRALSLDACLPLLRCAPAAAGQRALADVVDTRGRLPLAAASCEAIVLMGVLHHVPSTELRAHLVRSAANALRPGGILAVTVWRFADRDRFRARLAPWSLCPRVPSEQLEKGDHLLRWGASGGGDALRYCHHAQPKELERVATNAKLEPLESWVADGQTGDFNTYHLWRRAGTR